MAETFIHLAIILTGWVFLWYGVTPFKFINNKAKILMIIICFVATIIAATLALLLIVGEIYLFRLVS
jgi:fatty acid desaturase